MNEDLEGLSTGLAHAPSVKAHSHQRYPKEDLKRYRLLHAGLAGSKSAQQKAKEKMEEESSDQKEMLQVSP